MILGLFTPRAAGGRATRRSWWSASLAGAARREERPAQSALRRTTDEVAQMRRAGAAVAHALRAASEACRPGVSTLSLSEIVRSALAERGARPLFPGYVQGQAPPFPAAACVSINEEVVHGVPSERLVRPGDVVKIDVGARWPDAPEGWCADAATTVIVAGPDAARTDAVRGLVNATRAALEHACELMRPGVRWSTVAAAVQAIADAAQLGVVQDYVGHGVGRALHEPPRAPSYWNPNDGFGANFEDFTLEEGMTLAVEPIFTVCPRPESARRPGRTEVSLLDDGWTVVTTDRSVACHEEHTILVTPVGGAALTASSEA